jgi:hypothetical protein
MPEKPAPLLERTTFEVSRSAEYFRAEELQAQTGQPRARFVGMAIKELLDNGLDAAETARIAPDLLLEVQPLPGDQLRLAARDNGAGIPPETVERILNFETRTSDKAAYRAPTRGAQGNALKTIIGLPCALGSREPVIIEARGIRHRVTAWVDPAGEARINHQQYRVPVSAGTRVVLELPARQQELAPRAWARAFSLCNPHALVRFRGTPTIELPCSVPAAETEESYQSSVAFPGDWRKHLPSDLTSAWWYSVSALSTLIFSHIAAARRRGPDLTLRDFVRQFRGLSGSAAAKRVADQFPTISHLSDFEAQPNRVADLLQVMRATADAPSPNVLGLVGETHIAARLRDWYGIVPGRFWYRKHLGSVDGIPFAVEVAIAETRRAVTERATSAAEFGLVTALNFSPTFSDPLASTPLRCPEFTEHGAIGFLARAHVLESYANFAPEHGTAFLHLVCPALTFLDRGKSRLDLPPKMAEAIAETLWKAAQPLYREGERRRKDASKAERASQVPPRGQEPTIKDAVFAIMPQALSAATGNGQLESNTRRLFYQARRLVQELTSRPLEWGYFNELFTLYRAEHAAECSLIFNDPRGVLYEPHTGRSVPVGQRQVEAYVFPAWVYHSILYVEKKGVMPTLQAARIAERYDMAILAAEGYATVAARTLFKRAERDRDYTLFVVHDADPDGYNIARTLQEATARMPDYHVNVVDLGLTLQQGIDMGLQTETFERKKALPAALTLTETEKEYFTGRPAGKNRWIARRIELDAMSAPQFVQWLDQALQDHGAKKLVPPESVLLARTLAQGEARIRHALTAHILKEHGFEPQVQDALRALQPLAQADASGLPAVVHEYLGKEQAAHWTMPVDRHAGELAKQVLHGMMRTRRKDGDGDVAEE